MRDYITTRHGVLVPAAAFAEAVVSNPELREIATIERDWTRRFFGDVMTNEDDTLITRGSGKGLKVYDELERDTHTYADLQKRKLAVIARPWDVSPASDDDADVEVGSMVKELLGRLPFDRISTDLLDATLKGFSVGEVMWEVYESKEHGRLVAPKDIIARNQRRFTFGTARDQATLEHPLRLLTQQQMINGEALPDRKFVVHRFGAKDGSPFGLGLGNRLFWPVFFKKQGIGFWLTFCDKFGNPTTIGKYPKGAPKTEQDKLLAALRRIASDVGIIVPEGTEIELLEAARSGSTDTHEKLCRYMDEQISKAVLGGTMTSTAQAAGLGSGQAQVHDDVRKEIAKADADLLSDTLNGGLVRWMIEYNRPGARLPKVWRNFEEQEDLNKRAERDDKIARLGYRPTDAYITETYGPGWERKPDAPLPAVPGEDPPAEFAEGAADQRAARRAILDAIDQGAEQLSGDWQAMLGTRVDDMLALAGDCRDLNEFRARLPELLNEAPPAAFVESLARAGFTSGLAGRSGAALAPKGVAAFAGRVRALFQRLVA